MKRQTTLTVSCGRVLKAKAQTVIFTQVQSDDKDDKKKCSISNYIRNDAEKTLHKTYHINLIEDGKVEEEGAEDAPVELGREEEGTYIALLHEFKDVFAWSYKKMTGLDPKIVLHHLSVKKEARPVKQCQRRFRPELLPLIEGEVNKLIKFGFIQEVKYPTWIFSIVPVVKLYPSWMDRLDTTKYNADATYQRAIQKICDDMLHKNVECYVDDLVVKSKKRENHFHDLRKAFEHLRRNQLKMNPSQCAFGVTFGKFLGFIVH
ncbi:hypothetical protein Sango_1889500 [Sesamum angolense]|uniref:Reverse transcriptase domain-containing protein n=1 Tax=Sesamum angolense TaxID=2727404 RepID=A0AAE2BQK8_9LAMI|nr:hypothetical protein Sango_1889500 [Sesamum angolense]